MELLVASGVGVMTAAGVYLLLRARTFPVIIGIALLSYAVNTFLFATGRLATNLPPVISDSANGYTDPLPQALVLTAIVISFGMTAVIVVLALRAYLEAGSDEVDTAEGERPGTGSSGDGAGTGGGAA
ncbi:Na+/H+ antiporter subunit C [Pelagibius litoralis]|uniref:Na+/H+ antiporter subunit C n=1 Tax=Pelagibius litoralis TaxID=374515 RepID=A0A967CA59_9PROT|nr:Na+/H+ antiporter subunit C [Pelagibius litoralis]NIA67139.1 Na+/H+ antiporter subunit C [Pelagibius litoralis]